MVIVFGFCEFCFYALCRDRYLNACMQRAKNIKPKVMVALYDFGVQEMKRKIVAALILVVLLIVTIVLIVIFLQSAPHDHSVKIKTFLLSDSEQWFYEEFQGRRFQLVTYEENGNKTIFLVQVEWLSLFGPGVHWQVNEGHWYKEGALIAISSGLHSDFSSKRLDEDYLLGGLPHLEYVVIFEDFHMLTSLNFNTTVYNNATHAWNNSQLEMVWIVE
jgi:hypothetical protein